MDLGRRILRLAANTRGRDIVVGDIHGCFDQLDAALQALDFDPGADRLLSVGDLIDRGPRSHDALEYLAKPWFWAVQGNHESLAADALEGGDAYMRSRERYLRTKCGAGWLYSLAPGERRAWVEAFQRLPIVIEVATTDGGAYGVVHADVPAGLSWQQFKRRIADGDPCVMKTAIWGRDRCVWDDCSGVAGIDAVFVGHCIQPSATRRGNVWFIDTGAMLRERTPGTGSLTVMVATEAVEAVPTPA